MKISHHQILIAALILWTDVITAQTCPQQCTCTPDRQGIRVVCSGVFATLPKNIPVTTTTLKIKDDESYFSRIPKITATDFQNLPELETLELIGLQIKEVDANAFITNVKLSKLDLKRNEISAIPVNLFTKLVDLIVLDLSYNKISSVQIGTFTQLSNLNVLNLRNNFMTSATADIFNDLVKLERFDISNNKIEAFDPNVFKGLSFLRTVKINNCGLKTLDREFLSNIPLVNSLEIRDNNITYLPKDIFNVTRKMFDLLLDGNEIEEIPPGVLKDLQLKSLGLSRNKISTLNIGLFLDFTTERLRLSDNNLTSLSNNQFDSLNATLKFLYLDGNPLLQVTKSMFSYLPRLRKLDLSRTYISDFDPDVISGLELQLLNLSNCNFRSAKSELLEAFENVELVDISGNNWNCTCFQKNIRNWLQSSDYSQNCDVDKDARNDINKPISEIKMEMNCLKCGVYPRIYTGKLIVNLTDKDLEQCWYTDEWFTLERQVLIMAGALNIVLIIGFIITIIVQRLCREEKYDVNEEKRKKITVSVIPDTTDAPPEYQSSTPILHSLEDISDGQGRVFINPAFVRSNSRLNSLSKRQSTGGRSDSPPSSNDDRPDSKRPSSVSSIPSLDGDEKVMTVVVPNVPGQETSHIGARPLECSSSLDAIPPDQVTRLESCM